MANGFDAATAGDLPDEMQQLIARRARVLGPAYRLFYREPLHIVRGKGVWLEDAQGRRYLDLYNNVASVGHAHPAVLDAIDRQARQLNTHTRYLHETILDCAEAILGTMPEALANIMFTCTGSEANDLALRVAWHRTGAKGVIVTTNAYHGVTSVVSEISPSLGAGVPRGDHVRIVPAPQGAGDVGAAFAAGVEAAIADLQASGHGVAALICDTIFSSDGVYADPPGFLADAVAAVRAAGGLFIADEVQPGFARTGAAMWGFQRHGLVPDIVTMGKPMGNGQPVAAMAIQPDVLADFGAKARYFNTFGGSPVACAAALAVLGVIRDEGLMENSATLGAYLADGLRGIAKTSAILGDVRGAGLFVGVDVETDGQPDGPLAARLVSDLRDRGVLISATGPDGNVLKIRPPLCIGRAEIDHFLAVIAPLVTS
nr:aminotransferase class III-fold pyridoxal phosphate-dependent enzyme [Pseudooceanicola nanhaiensis]